MAFYKNFRIALVGVLLIVVIFFISIFNSKNTTPSYDTTDAGYSGGAYAEEAPMEIDHEIATAPLLAEQNILSKGRAVFDRSASAPIVADDGVPRPGQDTKVIRSGNITMRVVSAVDATNRITTLAQSVGGDILNSSFSKQSKDNTTGYLTAKIPSDKFAQAFDGIKEIGSTVLHDSKNTQDVTEEFIDLEAQIKNKRAEEEKMRGYLERAEDIDDLLKVEKQLTRVRGEVERLEGRMKYLSNKTDFATITVSLSEDAEALPPTDGWRPLQDAKDAINALIQKSQNLISAFIVFVISRLPFIVLAVIIIIIVYRIAKKVIRRFEV